MMPTGEDRRRARREHRAAYIATLDPLEDYEPLPPPEDRLKCRDVAPCHYCSHIRTVVLAMYSFADAMPYRAKEKKNRRRRYLITTLPLWRELWCYACHTRGYHIFGEIDVRWTEPYKGEEPDGLRAYPHQKDY